MQVDIQLFGMLRGLESEDRLVLETAGNAVIDARKALMAHADRHWPEGRGAILSACAFASSTAVLRDGMPLPDDGRLVVLPPVNGG